MKKTFALLGSITLLVSVIFMQPSGLGYAQGELPPTPTATPYPGEFDFVTFEMLDLADEVMLGPYANNYIRFGTPDSWAFQPGAKLVLEVDTTARSSRVFPENASNYSGALLEITLNDYVLDTVFLQTGPQTVEVPIPVEALQTSRSDGRHSLQIYLNAAIDCLFDHETSVLLKNTSGFSLPHGTTSPVLDLTLLPRPIFKANSILPEELVIVVPDEPTTQELRSAMIVAASFGRMSEGEQLLSLASTSSLSELQKTDSHIVMVGKSGSLPILQEVIFPVSHTAASSEGVIQMAVSPWNKAMAALYIGGGDDDAVLKAAQAFSSGSLRVGQSYSLSIVNSVAEAIEIKEVEDDRTFNSLGYPTSIMTGVGYSSLEYEFIVPLGKMPTDNSYLDLVFTHSATLDFDASSAVVLLNNDPLGTIRFSDETANTVNTRTFSIPAYAVKSGRNVITVEAEFVPSDYCSTLNDSSLWLSVSEDSLLHLPLVDADETLTTFIRDLGVYPAPFIDSPTLGETGLVFPFNDVYSWDLGAKTAASLGSYAIGKTLELSVHYADNIPEEDRLNRHLIIVGRASQLPIIAELKDSMPARFEAGSDMAVEDDSFITFSIPEGTDLGYLETFPSPWNSTRSVLTIMGSTPLGLSWAENALLNSDLKAQIQGDYVVVQADKIYAVDTRKSGLGTQNLSATAVPGAAPTAIPDNVPVTTHAYQQDWVEVAIAVTSGAIILLLLGLIIRALTKNRRK